MVSRIRVLQDNTINKIAAGEVIENTASVVKELVENSIDANSTEITVEVSSGGRHLIRVTDNGIGMNSDDVMLCLERHATSKIRNFEDLEHAPTLGFRGEAIPSIASVSKFMLLSCHSAAGDPQSAAQEATMVIVEGGNVIKCCPAARSQGTTVEVKSLFFNVPVRKKFMKAPHHDTADIIKILSGIALGHPAIKFQLISDQELILNTPGRANLENTSFQKLLERRISTILGAEFLSSTVPIDLCQDGYHLQGFLGRPSTTRPNRTGQHLFINHRQVISPPISQAVREGYGTALAAQRHPLYVLHVNFQNELVDVNVHPQKREVRLRQEHLLREIIAQGVRSVLCLPMPQSPSLLSSIDTQTSESNTQLGMPTFSPHIAPPSFGFAQPPTERTTSYKPIGADTQPEVTSPAQPLSAKSMPPKTLPWDLPFEEATSVVLPPAAAPLPKPPLQPAICTESTRRESVAPIEPVAHSLRPSAPEVTPVPITAMPVSLKNSALPPIDMWERQPFQRVPRVAATIPRYILLDPATVQFEDGQSVKEGLCLVDQKAAHMRVLYEKLLGQLQQDAQRGLPVEMQSLLIPLTIEFSLSEANFACAYLQELNHIGIGIQEFGKHTFLINALAPIFGAKDPRSLIADIIHEIHNLDPSKSWKREKEKQLALAVSRIAVPRDRQLGMEEAQTLIAQLMNCRSPYQCPMGKSTLICMNYNELARLFQK